MIAAASSVTQAVDWAAIGPPVAVTVAAVAALLVDTFRPGRRVALMVPTLGGPLVAFGLTAWLGLVGGGPRATFCAPGGGPATCSYVVDDFTVFFQLLVFAAVVVVVLISPQTIHAERTPPGEYAFAVLASAAGAATLAASRDLMTLVVALEVVSLPVFALTALRRYAPYRGAAAAEAALKMFLVSVVSTAVMLFGVSLVYGATGSLFLDRVAAAAPTLPGDLRPVFTTGAVLVIVGFGFKIAAVPFHFWAPDVYEGAPVPVAAYLSVVSKAAGFAGLVLVLTVGFPSIAPTWGTLLAVLAAVTMTLGNLVALRQRAAVRLLAWSSIAQSGYILSPLGIAAGTGLLGDAVGATTAYIAIYAAMNLGAFAVVTAVTTRHGSGALDDYRGLARTNPASGLALGFFLLCLAGLPPGLAGLFAKIVVFRAALLGSLGWLALVIAVNTVIGLYYYLAWLIRLFAAPRPAEATGDGRAALPVPVPVLTGAAIALAATAVLVLSVAPGVVMHVPLAAFGG